MNSLRLHFLLAPALFACACTTPEPVIKTVYVDRPVSVCDKPALEPPPAEEVAKLPADAKPAERIRAALADREAWKRDAQACRAQVEALK